MYSYVERVKVQIQSGELATGGTANLEGVGGVSGSILKRMEILEKTMQLRKVSGELNQGHPKIHRDKQTDTIKLEDTLVDFMDIMVNMNSRISNQYNQVKTSMLELE
jgi:hypothetical protein